MLQILPMLLQLLHKLHHSRWNGWREQGRLALNRHFVPAGGSLNTAEMTQMRRMARLMPPLCHMPLPPLSLLSFLAAV